MRIIKLHHGQVSIPKDAENQAREFYCNFLGLKEIPKPKSLEGRGGFWLQLGEIQIHFGVEDGVDRRATKAHLAYEVSDLQLWKAKLQGRGVEILDGIPIPNYDRFEFRDPFGNRVEFLQRISQD
jgi:catechol 2,3-dioxygenase-like lactoylglutathione lyase family enzyme